MMNYLQLMYLSTTTFNKKVIYLPILSCFIMLQHFIKYIPVYIYNLSCIFLTLPVSLLVRAICAEDYEPVRPVPSGDGDCVLAAVERLPVVRLPADGGRRRRPQAGRELQHGGVAHADAQRAGWEVRGERSHVCGKRKWGTIL